MANTVREFVVECLRGFYERLPFKQGMTYITYAELKNLRDTGSLVPGMQYRITDYRCSTTQQDTSTADNQFDIIVTADSSIVLNENARAAKHTDSSTDYFAKCNLEAWELKYCLDNDSDRFAWAKELKSPTSHQDIIGILNTNTNHEDIYVRYPLLDSSIGYAWVVAQTMASLSIPEWIYEIENFGEGDEGLVTSYVVYTDTLHPSIGDALADGSVVETSWGQGVVYYMKDEWSNECPYDFKNIMFRRWKITSCLKCPSLVVNNEGNPYGFYYGAKWNGENVMVNSDASYGSANGYFYTFALKDLASENWFDYTVVAHLGLKNDREGAEITCYNNHIGNFTDAYISGNGYIAKMLNNIVFFNVYTDLSDTSYAEDYSYCHSNSFGNDCGFNTFGNYCCSNTFGNNCGSNSFGNACNFNSFRNDCYSNTFGNNCRSNSFGNNCGSNSFGNICNFNSFRVYCCSNTFGNNCDFNSFGNYCGSNSFGNNCGSNSFENYCSSNSFGNYCGFNSFENNCSFNSFRDYCSYSSFGNDCCYIKFGNSSSTKSYYQYIIVENGNRNIYLDTTQTTSAANKIQNIKIAQGVNNKTITHNTVNDAFQTVYQPANSQTISV